MNHSTTLSPPKKSLCSIAKGFYLLHFQLDVSYIYMVFTHTYIYINLALHRIKTILAKKHPKLDISFYPYLCWRSCVTVGFNASVNLDLVIAIKLDDVDLATPLLALL